MQRSAGDDARTEVMNVHPGTIQKRKQQKLLLDVCPYGVKKILTSRLTNKQEIEEIVAQSGRLHLPSKRLLEGADDVIKVVMGGVP